MSADQVIEEQIENPAPEADEIEIIEAPEPEAEPEKKPFDPRTDKVDFSTPEQQEKFNYMYKQVKQSDTRNQMLTDLLTEQQKQLDELKGRFTQSDEADAEKILLSKIKFARDQGDDDAEIKATDELVKYRAEKIVSEKLNAFKGETVRAEPEVSAPEIEYVESLIGETDLSGKPVRPWLQENHPEFNNALHELGVIAQKYVNDPDSLKKSLADLDTVMKAKLSPPVKPPIQTRTPNPLQGGNLTNNKPKGTIKMTRQEIEIAKKLGLDPKRYAAKRDELNKKGTR